MATKNYSDWLVDRSKRLPTVLALGGTERSRVDEAISDVRKLVLQQAADFNHDRFNGAEVNMLDILGAAKTLPMMAERRLVEVRQMEAFKGEITELLNYLKASCESTVLLLVFDQTDQRLKLPKALATNHQLYLFDSPKEYEMPKLIQDYSGRHGVKLTNEAALMLTLIVGTDISLLENALLKLAVAVPSKIVSGDDVEKHIKSVAAQDAFAFGRFVVNGDSLQALSMMCRLRTAKEVPLKLVGLLAWQMRQIVRCRSLLDQGQSDSAAEKQLGLFGKNRELVQVAKKSTLSWHISRLTRLAKLDQELKSLPGSPWLYFENCIMQLCRQRPLPTVS